MRAEVQAFAKGVPSGKTFILLCKCPLNSYLYCNISVDSVSKPHWAKLQNVISKPLTETMKKTILILITLLISKLSFGQKDNNLFLKLSFDSVVFYDFGGLPEDEIMSIIDNNGKLSSSVKKSTKLGIETAKKFTHL